jgi:hypothetical protein
MTCNNDDLKPRGLFYIDFDEYGKPIHIVHIMDEKEKENKTGYLNTLISHIKQYIKNLIKSFSKRVALLLKKIIRFCVNIF